MKHVIAAALLALSGCASQPIAIDATKTSACVYVRWTPQARVEAACQAAGADGHPQACLFMGNTIITRRPNSWADDSAFTALGHELYHALGAQHDGPTPDQAAARFR